MAYSKHPDSQALCPACDIGPFIRNNYFTGKLMLERDFTEEQRYYIDKLRHHHQHLHGWGVVCGLKVKAHPTPACRDRFICIDPGTAIDCCGHEIVLREPECIDIQTLPALKALADKHDTALHTLQICIRYRECSTEEIPVLCDECGCNDIRCAPNRILESYEIDVIVDPPAPAHSSSAALAQPCADSMPPQADVTGTMLDIAPGEPHPNQPHPCEEIFWRHLEGCPRCDMPNCVVLATIEHYHLGDKIEDQTNPPSKPEDDEKAHIARIDNRKGRHLLPSTNVLVEIIRCILENCCQPRPVRAPDYISTWLVLGPVFDPRHQTVLHHPTDGHPMPGDLVNAITDQKNLNRLNPFALSNPANIGSTPLPGDIVEYGPEGILAPRKYEWKVRGFSGVMWTNIHDIEDDIHMHLPGDGVDDPFDAGNYFNFFGKDHALVFFLVYIRSLNEKTLETKLYIRHDDAVRVWFNGQEIAELKSAQENDIKDYIEKAALVRISPGDNILLVAVAERHIEWGMSARFEHDEGVQFFAQNPVRLREKRQSEYDYVSIRGEAYGWGKDDPDRILFCEGNGLWRGRVRLLKEEFKFFLRKGDGGDFSPTGNNIKCEKPGLYEVIFREKEKNQPEYHLLLTKPFKPEFE